MEFVSNGGTTLFPRNELQQIRLPNPSTMWAIETKQHGAMNSNDFTLYKHYGICV
jgi:hypothetical protein